VVSVVFVCTFLLFTVTAFTFEWPPPWFNFLNLKSSQSSNDPQYERLLQVVSGYAQSQCAAEPSASKVQLFQNGWLLARFGQQTFYAIIKTTNPYRVTWTSHVDDYTGSPTKCVGVVNEDLLALGFRHWYCGPDSADLRTKLGNPTTLEMGAWVQFEQWSNGLLVYGLPGNDLMRKGSFTELVGIFLDSTSADERFQTGRRVQFTFHNAAPKDTYCAALWYPANTGKPIPDDLQRNCSSGRVSAVTYLQGHNKCLVSGFD
jgi:hypothetical protein